MATSPTRFSALVVRPCLVVRPRRNRGQRNPAPKKPLPRRGTDRVFAAIAFDVGRKPRKGGRARIFANALRAETLSKRRKDCKMPLNPLEEDMRTIGHFIGGREVKGTSGRFADVFEPMTGDVQAQVALASKAELRAAVENAKAAQPEWGATNPQRRARVMMKFLELAQRDYDKLADLLAREHGKTVPDAKGDIQRGLEVVEFACGIPHLMKGEYTEGAGPGIDIYSMRQPLGVVAGITPFNFPAMIPMWKFAPAIACGN